LCNPSRCVRFKKDYTQLQIRKETKIHTTKLYLASNGEANSAEISIEIPNGTGDISISIHKAGSSNHILGPNGWQSADHWFTITPIEVNNDHVGWFNLPAKLVKHITYSNYSVFCRRVGSPANTRSILTGGALVAKPSHTNAHKGAIELPPLPAGFPQAALGSFAVVDKTREVLTEVPTVLEKPAVLPQDHATHKLNLFGKTPHSSPEPEFSPVQPQTIASSVMEPEVTTPVTVPVSTHLEAQPSPANQAHSSTTHKLGSGSNQHIILGVLAVILLAIAVYFFGFRDTSSVAEGNNTLSPALTKLPEPPPEPAPKSELAIPSKTPEPPSVPENKAGKLSAPEVKQPPKESPKTTPIEPAKPVPPLEKVQPAAPTIPDLNRMVNEALKR
jgi:hypothetical protein